MEACWEANPVNNQRMLNNEILNEAFCFPVKKLITSIFWDTQEGLKF